MIKFKMRLQSIIIPICPNISLSGLHLCQKENPFGQINKGVRVLEGIGYVLPPDGGPVGGDAPVGAILQMVGDGNKRLLAVIGLLEQIVFEKTGQFECQFDAFRVGGFFHFLGYIGVSNGNGFDFGLLRQTQQPHSVHYDFAPHQQNGGPDTQPLDPGQQLVDVIGVAGETGLGGGHRQVVHLPGRQAAEPVKEIVSDGQGDLAGADTIKNWTVGVNYQMTPAVGFQLAYDEIDYGNMASSFNLSEDTDRLIRFRTVVNF